MEWDSTIIALVASSLLTFFGILPQLIQSISAIKETRQRSSAQAIEVKSSELSQFAGATQTMQTASSTLIQLLQEEVRNLRAENATLDISMNACERAKLKEHLSGQRLLNDLSILRNKHLQEYHRNSSCPFGQTLDNLIGDLIEKYEPIFANGTDLSDDKEPKETPNG